MAVTEVHRLWEGETGDDNIDRKRTYTAVWEVLTDDANDDATVAAGPTARDLGLPGNGYLFPSDSGSFVVGIRPQRDSETPYRWIVTFNYSSEFPSRQQGAESQQVDEQGQSSPSPSPRDRVENPLDRLVTYSTSHEKFTEPATHTWQNIPILNCADDPYDPGIEVSRSLAILTVTKTYRDVNFDWLDEFVDSVNATRWRGRKKRTCKMDGIDWVNKYEAGVSFVEVQFRIAINRKTWDHLVIERGWHYKENVGGSWVKKKVPIPVDTAGRAKDEVPLLNGARASGATYATDYVKSEDGTAGSKRDGSNPAISGVAYASAENDGTKGRGILLADGLPPAYTRWRIQPEKSFNLLGI